MQERIRDRYFVLVSYDIPDDRRRLKVARAMLDYGGDRVQRSVFECYLTRRNLDTLQARLTKLCDVEADSIRFYILCESCRGRTIYLGKAGPTDEPGLLII